MTKSGKRKTKASRWQMLIPRLMLGVIFTFSGMNGLFNLLPVNFSTEGAAFIDAMRAGGFYTLLKGAELTAGILLLFNFAGQLGVLILVPICLGIVSFHWFLSPQGALLGWAALALEVLMLVIYRKNFIAMFKGRNDPAEIIHREHERRERTDLSDWMLRN